MGSSIYVLGFSSVFFDCHHGRTSNYSTGPANTPNHRNAPSEIKWVQNHNFQDLRSGFGKPLVSICLHPMCFFPHAIYITLAVFGGPLKKEKKTRVDDIFASCNIVGFLGSPTQAMFFTLFKKWDLVLAQEINEVEAPTYIYIYTFIYSVIHICIYIYIYIFIYIYIICVLDI